uniref:Uncharacterized protein n=1 Tax=Arundo donax TaxID=35708 RepID=A0A0A9B632_ARUDO
MMMSKHSISHVDKIPNVRTMSTINL